LAPVAFEVVRSRQQNLSGLQPEVVNALFEAMRSEALAVVRQGAGNVHFEESRHAYMRYAGQGHEIPVSLPAETYGQQHGEIFRAAFESAYARLYGRIIEGVDIEVLSWTLTISAASAALVDLQEMQQTVRKLPESEGSQALFDPSLARWVDTPVYLRSHLRPGDRLPGPVLITEDQTTTVVTSLYEAEIDPAGHIVMTRMEAHDE